MVVSLLIGFLICQRLSVRVILFALSIPLSIAVNILRVTGTAIIADYHEQFALGFYHSFTGWLVFIGGFAILYSMARVLNWLTRSSGGGFSEESFGPVYLHPPAAWDHARGVCAERAAPV